MQSWIANLTKRDAIILVKIIMKNKASFSNLILNVLILIYEVRLVQRSLQESWLANSRRYALNIGLLDSN